MLFGYNRQNSYGYKNKLSRWQRLNIIQQKQQLNKQIIVIHPKRTVIESLKHRQQLSHLILSILRHDKKLLNLINIFPCQLTQLELTLPSKTLRPTLKLLNTIIDSSQKQIKNDDIKPNWKQQAIQQLFVCYKQWQLRWQILQYRQLVEKADKFMFMGQVKKILEVYGIEQKFIFSRGIVMRYLMDIENKQY